MSALSMVGKLERSYDGKQVEWKIDLFSAIDEDEEIIESERFSFGNAAWYIRLWLKSISKPDCMALMLGTTKKHDYKVDYQLGIKREDNNVEVRVTGNLEENSVCTDYCYIERSEILQDRKRELKPKDELTITCYLKQGEILPNVPKSATLKSFDRLSENFASLFCDEESCDVTLRMTDTDYKAHKTVLIARSSVFRDMFRRDTSAVYAIGNCDQEAFGKFLKFLYNGELDELFPNIALHLYEISEIYNVQELKTFCSEYLMENLTVQNLCDVAIIAHERENEKLLLSVQQFFNKNLNAVLKTPQWKNFWVKVPNLANKLMVAMSEKVKVVD